MTTCFFVSDLHGRIEKYEKLFEKVTIETPAGLFLGGDLLPSSFHSYSNSKISIENFIADFLFPRFNNLKENLKEKYPQVFLILGNDDSRVDESAFIAAEKTGLWKYINNKVVSFGNYSIFGYSFIPPSPFLLKDWEKYDVSRYVDPGCISPEEGIRTVPFPKNEIKFSTIKKDIDELIGSKDVSNSIFLFHSPPYKTNLDRAALDGKSIDYVPLDSHVGSIAIKRMIEERQPLLTLHGHVHESAKLTGSWQDKIGGTFSFSAAHEGKELSLIRFDPENLKQSSRELY